MIGRTRKCLSCGAEFFVTPGFDVVCSPICEKLWRRPDLEITQKRKKKIKSFRSKVWKRFDKLYDELKEKDAKRHWNLVANFVGRATRENTRK